MTKLFKKRITLGELAQDTELFYDEAFDDYFGLIFCNNELEEIYVAMFYEEDGREKNAKFYQYCTNENCTTLQVLISFLQSDNLKDLKVKRVDFWAEWGEIEFFLDEDIDTITLDS